MQRLAAGHGPALNDLMSRHAERLFHYLIRVLRDESEAEDLAQETFVRVFQHSSKYDPSHKFTTWLYSIATNLARDRLRRLSRHPQVPLDGGPGHDEGAWEQVIPASDPGPLEQLAGLERAEAVRRAVAELPEELRVPLVLAEYEEQSHAEIAAVLGCSSKAVEMRVYRARQFLRKRLGGLVTGLS